MLTVHLHNLLFHSYHGLYAGEEQIGNNFEVNLDVTYDASKEDLDSLKYLINYEDLYKIVQKRMEVPTPLLEELANGIMHRIKHQYARVESIRISIFKLKAPIEHFQGKVGVSFFQKFEV
jgi:dihydroneopterin aldolase